MKNILIISSDLTGHGHKSITESLTEQLTKEKDVKVKVVDGFALSGNIGLGVGKLYGSVTRTSKDLWKVIWEMSNRKPDLIVDTTEFTMKERLIKLINSMKPDAIVSTHPNYVTSVLNILQEYCYSIPFYTVIADPVTISPLWADTRARYTLCPTPESMERCLEYGVPEERMKVFGFPIRYKFCKCAIEGHEAPHYDNSRPLHCLIMSGGEGSGNMSRIAKKLVKSFNCTVTIVCGRNKILQKRLENTLSDQYRDTIRIFGFVKEIQELMLESDIVFARASPNSMLEAVMCNVPLVITSALPGQEEGNPGYVLKYNLGIVCRKIPEIKKAMTELLADNAKKLNEIKSAQLKYRNPYSSINMVKFILEDLEKAAAEKSE